MKSEDIIYPNIDLKEAEVLESHDFFSPKKYHIRLLTNVRKLGIDNKWYSCCIMRKSVLKVTTFVELNIFRESCLSIFLNDVYNFQLFGIINHGMQALDGTELYVLDKNQDSEEERIKKLLNYNEAGI